jgi:hypothetical protein
MPGTCLGRFRRQIRKKAPSIFEKMIAFVEDLLGALKDTHMVVQGYLLHYLKDDEHKHLNMLAALDSIKRGVYPYVSS